MRRSFPSVAAIATLLVLGSGALADARRPAVAPTLALPSPTLRAGQQLSATLVNPTAARLELALCPILARKVAGRWVTVTHTHGVDIACRPDPTGAEVPARARHAITLELYDDLAPGVYRVTLPYRPAGARHSEPPFSSASPTVAATFTLARFSPGPAPQLSERRILAIAHRAAQREGDAHPTLIQHAEGSRLMANLVADGDLVYAWNWSYLIAERGTFQAPIITSPPGIPMGPGPVRLTYHVLTLVVNARTGQVTDGGGGSRRYPDLARLGAVHTDSG
jgi:hypothetical protein